MSMVLYRLPVDNLTMSSRRMCLRSRAQDWQTSSTAPFANIQ